MLKENNVKVPSSFPTQTNIIRPLLEWIDRNNGEVIVSRDMPFLAKDLGHTLGVTEHDMNLRVYPDEGSDEGSGYNHWENHIRWSRKKAVEKGYISNGVTGVWPITSLGVDYIKDNLAEDNKSSQSPVADAFSTDNMEPGKLTITEGDATDPKSNARIILIPHVCNDIGAWGSGFVLAIDKRFGYLPMAEYKNFISPPDHYVHGDETINSSDKPAVLGDVQFVLGSKVDIGFPIKQRKFIVNMIGQEGCGKDEYGNPPIRYDAIACAMQKIAVVALAQKEETFWDQIEIHCPKFGCGLAGGSWEVISGLIENIWIRRGLDVTVYDYKAK